MLRYARSRGHARVAGTDRVRRPGGATADKLTAEDVVLTGIEIDLASAWWTYSNDDRARARNCRLLGCEISRT